MAGAAPVADAEYGCLAFDVFLMERWDHTADPADDAKQWESAVHAYLALTPRQRHPYHQESLKRKNARYKVDSGLAARLFIPHQTLLERSVSVRRASQTSPDPLWVRTCYAPEFDSAYASMAAHVVGVGGNVIDRAGALDDSNIYSFDGDWARVLLRLPELCDVVRFANEELHEEREQEIEGAEGEMERLSMKVVERLYIVDREALEEGLVKVIWLDCHGECLWNNKIRPEGMLDFTGAWRAMVSLDEILETFAEKSEKGARLLF